MEPATVITLGPRVDTSPEMRNVQVATFEEAFGEYSEARGKWRKKRAKKRAARRADKKARRTERRQFKLENKQEKQKDVKVVETLDVQEKTSVSLQKLKLNKTEKITHSNKKVIVKS